MKEKKQQLRKYIKAKIAELSCAQIQDLSTLALQQLESLSEFALARNIAAYWSMSSELNTHGFIEKWAQEKNIFLPLVDGHRMDFVRFEDRENMLENRFGIAEPRRKNDTETPIFDIMIVPALGYDKCGHRLGHGGGFYDRYFEEQTRKESLPRLKIGVCLDIQVLENIPKESFDVDLDIVITPTNVIICNNHRY